MLSTMEKKVLGVLGVLAVLAAALHEAAQLKELGDVIQAQMMEDYYAMLGIGHTASMQEIKTAYKRATTAFQARPHDEDVRLKRAMVMTAHETLVNPEAREAYDARRNMVLMASQALSIFCVVVPLFMLLAFNWRVFRSIPLLGTFGLNARSFEGKVLGSFGRMQATLQVGLTRASAEDKLGLRLVPTSKGGPCLQVAAIGPDSVADKHNRKARAVRDASGVQGPAWWLTEEVWVGDLVIGLNGITGQDAMMQEFARAVSLQLTIKRCPATQALLPWVTEVELKKVRGERWGCQMSNAADGSPTLEVLEIDHMGALARWNMQHPKLRVMPGDRICAVNKTVGVKAMLNALRDPENFESGWMVMRGVLKSPSLPELHGGPFIKREGQKLGIRIGSAMEAPIRGCIVEPDGGHQVVVKEVVPNYLVDEWNRSRPLEGRIREGMLVTSVNGNHNSQEFSAEFAKAQVHITTRLPMGGCGSIADVFAAGRCATVSAEMEAAEPQSVFAAIGRLLGRALGPLAPSFLKPVSFEQAVKQRLSQLRCEFEVELKREEGKKVGMQLQPVKDKVGGLSILDIVEDSLVGKANAEGAGDLARIRGIKVGDRLVSVNGVISPPMMLQMLGNQSISRLKMSFSRKAMDASPGLWEAEIERLNGEGWGVELREPADQSKSGLGALRIDGVSAGMALDRWNQRHKSSGAWTVEAGDLVIAVEPQVEISRMLQKLREANKVKIYLLRWHSGPAPPVPSIAPEPTAAASAATSAATSAAATASAPSPAPAPAAAAAPPAAMAAAAQGKPAAPPAAMAAAAQGKPDLFEVILARNTPDERLGIKLEASPRDPTRTAVQEVLPNGLFAAWNRRAEEIGRGDLLVRRGDEVETVNGEADSTRFMEQCREQRVVMRFSRYSKFANSQPAAPAAAAPFANSQPAAPAAAAPVPAKEAQASPVAAVSSTAPAEPEAAPEDAFMARLASAANRKSSDQEAKENKELFLLRQEVEQLRRKLAEAPQVDELELLALKQERDELASDNAMLKSRVQDLMVTSRQSSRAEEQHLKSKLESQDAQLQDLLRRNMKMIETEERLEAEVTSVRTELQETQAENARLTSLVKDLECRPSFGDHKATPATMTPMSVASLQSLEALSDNLSQLQELSLSLEHVLSCDDGLEA
eukprot:TRINITY_DN1866_c0_g1_i1.p1 TRINITY_DN1866_c0_g1~~TRINITY_DN1866_c0_g1_i1.p1  ORF type:complete len:1159 (-),score=327.35 TRINITY_DN1866_c0_g1_i1:107-3583(-)